MIPQKLGGRSAVICAAVVALFSTATHAQSVDAILKAEQSRLRSNQQSQVRIDKVVQDTRDIVNDYRAITKEIDGLKIYNRLMQAQTTKQQAKLDEIAVSMEKANVINRQIFPLMTRMIEGLKKFVALDVPFLMDERTERVAKLEGLMDEPNVSVAEKFRKVMEAYQIENEYGRTIESYKGAHEGDDGSIRQVNFLRVGRVALLFQSDDASITMRWDNAARDWVDASDYRNEMKAGLDVATQKVAPDLLMMPVAAAEAR